MKESLTSCPAQATRSKLLRIRVYQRLGISHWRPPRCERDSTARRRSLESSLLRLFEPVVSGGSSGWKSLEVSIVRTGVWNAKAREASIQMKRRWHRTDVVMLPLIIKERLRFSIWTRSELALETDCFKLFRLSEIRWDLNEIFVKEWDIVIKSDHVYMAVQLDDVYD